MQNTMNNGSVMDDPSLCGCGTVRQSRKGIYFCTNCDSAQHVENVDGVRVRTPEDIVFDATYRDLIDGWYEEGLGADPIFRVKDGKPETFEDVYGQIDKEI